MIAFVIARTSLLSTAVHCFEAQVVGKKFVKFCHVKLPGR